MAVCTFQQIMSQRTSSTLLSNEDQLLARVASGDQHAFKEVYEFYFSRTYNFAFYVLHDREAAQEIVQEVMLHIWQMGPQLTGIRSLEAYLKTLAKRKAIDQLRRIALERKISTDQGLQWQESHNDTVEGIILKDTRAILERGIAQLPPQQKAVYQLCQQQGLKYEEAAQQLNIAPATVHRHMKLALKSLRLYVSQHTNITVLLIILRLF